MPLDDALRARQTDPRPADAADHVTAAFERLKDIGQVLGRDADALVAHNNRRPAILRRERHTDAAARRAVLDGIADQVIDDALNATRVEHADDLGRVRVEHQLMPTRSLLVLLDPLTGNLDQ